MPDKRTCDTTLDLISGDDIKVTFHVFRRRTPTKTKLAKELPAIYDCTMKDSLGLDFGLLIAFLLPGFLLLWGASLSLPEVKAWLVHPDTSGGQTIGSFLFASLASLALGLVISAVRAVLFDEFLYRFTGLSEPTINDANLKKPGVCAAYQAVIENHYRYYQYYAHSLVALVTAFVLYAIFAEEKACLAIWIGAIIVSFLLGVAARSELKAFNEKAADVTR